MLDSFCIPPAEGGGIIPPPEGNPLTGVVPDRLSILELDV